MRKQHILFSSLMLALLSMVGCDKSPALKLEFNPTTAFNFGSVDITTTKTENLTVVNNARVDAVINAIRLADGSNGQYVVNLEQSTCLQGQSLAVGASCTINVSFTPSVDVPVYDSLEIHYSQDPSITPEAAGVEGSRTKMASVELHGIGNLNCALDTELAARYQTGVTRANDQMALDVINATNLANSRTYQDGYNDGYAATYNRGYNTGYNSSQGYDLGYSDGFRSGYAIGSTDVYACDSGRANADNDAENDASNDASIQATYDANDIGYSDGHAEGYYDGYYSISCASANKDLDRAGARILKGILNDTFGAKCESKGYTNTYSRTPYQQTYDAVLANNVDYQNGLSVGRDVGYTQGVNAGRIAGYNDGRSQGNNDGLHAGQDDYYLACYQSAYPSKYAGYYSYFYPSYYRSAYDSAFDSGYYDGFDDGVYDATIDCSGVSSSASALTSTSSEASAQMSTLVASLEAINTNFVSTVDGKKVAVAANLLSQPPLMLKEVNAALYLELLNAHSNLRNELRTNNSAIMINRMRNE